jgi:hypothetical protein
MQGDTGVTRNPGLAPTYHARVLEGVAKSHFLLKAVGFKSQKRVVTRF